VTPWIVLPTLAVYWLAALLLQVYGLNCYIMIVLFWRRRRERAREEQAILSRFAQTRGDDDLPVVTTQLPIFNECNVVERLMQAACAFDYPPGKHEIQVLDDSTDETVDIVRELAARMRAEGHDIHHLHRPHRTGYKAGALEDGLRVARGELVAVFDADFVPEPDFLRKTVPFLVDDPSLGFVQTRWGHRNRGFSPLTRVQAIGIDGHFVVEQSARSWNRLFFNFNGTGGIWRKEAIHRAGGWQADTLTEDLDLSYRTQLAGYSARFLVDVITPAELPTDVNAFKSQQHRWAKGSIQTAMKLLPVIWRRPDISRFKKFESTVHLTHYLVHPLMLIMTILILPLLMWTEFTFKTVWVAVPFALMFLAVFAPTSMYALAQVAANRDWRRAVWILPFLMSVGIGLAVNNTRAVIDAFLGRKSEFVRTPKLGTLAETPVRSTAGALPAGSYGGRAVAAGGLIRYHLPRKRLFVLEILVGVWAAAAFVQYILLHKFLVGPLLLIQAVGFIYVGVLSYLHDVRARRPV
jgi:cellulose synthase/poly-beta-1,6-N-acetylglucosamine synthase-like glycosyltransferase